MSGRLHVVRVDCFDVEAIAAVILQSKDPLPIEILPFLGDKRDTFLLTHTYSVRYNKSLIVE